MIDISVIILCKNEKEFIGSTLNMVFAQSIDKKFEVIIIDSGSRDDTLEIARRYPVRIVQVNPKHFGHAKTRNYGVLLSKGEYIVFLNADAVPINAYWLKNLINNFNNDEDIAGVYSRIYPRQNCNPLRSWEILKDTYYFDKKVKFIGSSDKYNKLNIEDKRRLISFHTISCAIKKDILIKHPFNENINFGEDLEWSKRMLEGGFKIVYESNSKVLHSHNFYHSFIYTVKKYFDDAKLNNRLLDRYRLFNIHILLAHVSFKLLKDIGYILKSDKNLMYKISWILYSPVIRIAEFSGITLASFIKLPSKLERNLSLANQIINQ